MSSHTSRSFEALRRTLNQVVPEALVAPVLMVAATDSRHYEDLCQDIYRFMPVRMTAEDLARVHGTNERVAVEGYARAVHFYRQFLLNVAG